MNFRSSSHRYLGRVLHPGQPELHAWGHRERKCLGAVKFFSKKLRELKNFFTPSNGFKKVNTGQETAVQGIQKQRTTAKLEEIAPWDERCIQQEEETLEIKHAKSILNSAFLELHYFCVFL